MENKKNCIVSKTFPITGLSLSNKDYSLDDDLSLQPVTVSNLSITPGKIPAAKQTMFSDGTSVKKKIMFGTPQNDVESDGKYEIDDNMRDNLQIMTDLLLSNYLPWKSKRPVSQNFFTTLSYLIHVVVSNDKKFTKSINTK